MKVYESLENKEKRLESNDFSSDFYKNIKGTLQKARSNTYKQISSIMVKTYWEIGRLIVEEEQKGAKRAKYGEYLIKELSLRLIKDFGKGFNVTNLKYIRQFFLTFPKGHAVRDQLSWTHYRLILKVDEEKKREFYVNECIESNWSTRELERQINSQLYERMLISKKGAKSQDLTSTPLEKQSAKDIIKDPYVLDFLDIKEPHNFLEKDLEQALINKLQDFILELGKGFAFVSRQYRISLDGDHFYVDLVFYNYILKCFILIDLKSDKLTHKDIGQMDFYVRYFEREVKRDNDNPTIGLILCSSKNESMVKYTMLEESNSLFASEYKLYLPTEEELKAELFRERQILRESLAVYGGCEE